MNKIFTKKLISLLGGNDAKVVKNLKKIKASLITFFKYFKRKNKYKRSYSQCGEDMIIKHIFDSFGIMQPSYIDIGAHDPYFLSNTAYFYESGSTGINIEPNPVLFENIKKVRRKDINLNIGIGNISGNMDFYLMDSPTMSTFSKKQADNLCLNHKTKIEKTINVKVKPLMDVINEYCNGIFPDFLSCDAEGLDFDIIKSIDYKQSSPKVICVEAVEYTGNVFGRKETEIINFLEDQGYYFYADTGNNSIFIKK